jgi:general secretion pathway protein K
MRQSRVPSDERGFILVTVLIVIAVLLPVVLAFSAKVQLNLMQAENFRNSVQAVRSAGNGVTGAIGILKADDASYDSRKETWATSFPALALGEGASQGILTVAITDEDGKIPVNRLLKDTKGSTTTVTEKNSSGSTPQTTKQTVAKTTQSAQDDPVDRDMEARLRALVTRLGAKPEIIDALIDWLDLDNEPTGAEGAEDEYYKSKGYSCKNGPLDSLEELLLVKGFDRELVTQLREYLTTAPVGDGKINVNTAPAEVLYSLLGTKTTGFVQPLNESDVEDLDHYRQSHELKGVGDIGSAIKISQDQLGRIGGIVKVNSSFFTVNSKYTIGRMSKSVEALLKRDGSSITVMSWREY